MSSHTELWRTLKIGDRIRLMEYPAEFNAKGYVISPATASIFKVLLKRKRSLRVCEIDEYGLPWIYCRTRGKTGRTLHHYVAMDNCGLVKVKPRRLPR